MRYGYTFMWVADVPGAVEFYEKAFGVTRKVLMENGADGWYAEIDTGPTTLAIADLKEAERILSNVGVTALDPDAPATPVQLSFIADDVPAALQTAIDAGAQLQQAPETKPWGQTIARVRDPNGLLVSIVTEPPSFN